MATKWAVAVLALAAASSAGAQSEGDACALMGSDAFKVHTGREEYSEPVGMLLAGGSVCGYDNGQILLFTGAGSRAAFDGLLAGFGQEDLPRTPVEGLGEGAFSLLYDPDNPYQDHGAFVVFGTDTRTVAVTVYAQEGEPAEAALPAAMSVARAISAELD